MIERNYLWLRCATFIIERPPERWPPCEGWRLVESDNLTSSLVDWLGRIERICHQMGLGAKEWIWIAQFGERCSLTIQNLLAHIGKTDSGTSLIKGR